MIKTEISGEARHSARRRRFWLAITLFVVLGGVAGFLLGLSERLSGAAIHATPEFTIAAVAVGIIALTALSIWFFRAVDELEVADNLWASLYGYYFYAAAFPSWWVLANADLAPPVDPWALYVCTILFSFAVYGIRKVINR